MFERDAHKAREHAEKAVAKREGTALEMLKEVATVLAEMRVKPPQSGGFIMWALLGLNQ